MKAVLYSIICLLLIASCNEIDKVFNPSSDYIIEKDITPSSDEQVLESGSEFKMIFPANSLSGNLEVKVKKESSVPELNVHNLKKGKNFYKIKFNGDGNILKPIQIIINYDKSAIPTGKTAPESVFGYIYSSGSWKLADYELDETNGKIIISLSSINGKVSKDEPILLEDGEIIIGGFTTVDKGQNDDDLLEILSKTSAFAQSGGNLKMKYERIYKDNNSQSSSDITDDNWLVNLQTTDFYNRKLQWSGVSFSLSIDTIIDGYNYSCSIGGNISSDGKVLNHLVWRKYLTKKVTEQGSNGVIITIEEDIKQDFEMSDIPLGSYSKEYNEISYNKMGIDARSHLTKYYYYKRNYSNITSESESTFEENIDKIKSYELREDSGLAVTFR